MNLEEKFVRNITKYEGKIFTMLVDEVLCPNGNSATREIVSHRGGVCIAPITQDGQLIFIRQYRYAYKKVLLELPAGKLEAGENPLESGKRELREETGAVAGIFESLGEFYPTCGYCNEIIHLYYAADLTFSHQDLDEDEFIETVKIPFDKALDMVMSGEIKDGKTIAAVLKLGELSRRRLLNGNL